MTKEELIGIWKEEERIAHIHGWDFSHIKGRCTEEEGMPWNYRDTVLQYLKPEMRLLDIDTGGGEFLLNLNHPFENTSATEGYPPNAELCMKTLLPLGIDFRQGTGSEKLPFDDGCFDIIINRHGQYLPEDIYRLLKSGGIFVTQQVGAENDRSLIELLCGESEIPFPEQYPEILAGKFRDAGFEILTEEECYLPVRFTDVGSLVWFARIIEWEFPRFSVDGCFDRLLKAQQIIEQTGYIEGMRHRLLLVARKKLDFPETKERMVLH